MRPVCIFVMGVSGSGKSTLGKALSEAFNLLFLDADDLHPASNIAKMARGEALTDADREPWLEIVRETAEAACGLGVGDKVRVDGVRADEKGEQRGVVIACSALKKSYRDILRGLPSPSHPNPPSPHPSPSFIRTLAPTLKATTYFVHIEGRKELIADRMEKRAGHFMKAVLLDSQLETLESPVGEENVIVVQGEETTQEQVEVVRGEIGEILGREVAEEGTEAVSEGSCGKTAAIDQGTGDYEMVARVDMDAGS